MNQLGAQNSASTRTARASLSEHFMTWEPNLQHLGCQHSFFSKPWPQVVDAWLSISVFSVIEVHFIVRMPDSQSLLTCVLSYCGKVHMHAHTCTHFKKCKPKSTNIIHRKSWGISKWISWSVSSDKYTDTWRKCSG